MLPIPRHCAYLVCSLLSFLPTWPPDFTFVSNSISSVPDCKLQSPLINSSALKKCTHCSTLNFKKITMALSFSFFFFLPLIISSVTGSCDRCLHQSKASFYSSPSSVSTGACGYGSVAATLSNGFVAAAASSIYGDGIGCGGCFQVRCKNKELCNSNGVNVTITDENKGNATDLVLSDLAFMAMAKPGFSYELMKAGTVDVEYKRVACNYKENLSIRVEEGSKRPNNLTVTVLYQGGQTDLDAMDVARLHSSNWMYMSRDHGVVWSTTRAPPGPLQFRFVVTAGFDGKWVWANREVLPLDWKVGMMYDTGVRITDVKEEGCGTCDCDHP